MPVDDLTMQDVGSMMADVRAHYRASGEIDESQVCRNLMVTRVKDFSSRIDRCRAGPSDVHGDGLFSTRAIDEGDLITFFPGDAMLFWESGDRTSSSVMVFYGAHVPQSERDAEEVTTTRVKEYELYANSKISVVGDPAMRDDAAYLGHFANDATTCASEERVESYRQASKELTNAEPVLLESCHFALQAKRKIEPGEEILYAYGEGYWLARAGYKGVGSDLRLIGSGVRSSAQGDALKRALASARPQKRGKASGKSATKAGSKAKARRQASDAKRSAAKGFGAG